MKIAPNLQLALFVSSKKIFLLIIAYMFFNIVFYKNRLE